MFERQMHIAVPEGHVRVRLLSPGSRQLVLAKRAAAIGMFDGVHAGHAAVVALLLRQSKQLGLTPTVVTFSPHPRAVVQPKGLGPLRLQTSDARADMLFRLGVEEVIEIQFDATVAAQSPQSFATILAQSLGVGSIIVGEDFRFGSRRSGDVSLLRTLGGQLGFDVSTAFAVTDPTGRISSTRIRSLVAEGKLAEAESLLGRPHVIEAITVARTAQGEPIPIGTGAIARPKSGVFTARMIASGHPPLPCTVSWLDDHPQCDAHAYLDHSPLEPLHGQPLQLFNLRPVDSAGAAAFYGFGAETSALTAA